ncbi:Hypothetical protein CINCED_3A021574 [Cinara cedri]|uniref:Uncharacterized protein n=1 Tax=Cinara cedri TaxID=506608 RepID=A0A5E4NGJ6_9HEMI|nr:Hypothetical protein CINCED_3A021574 [Cinara cedri]
MRGLNHLENKGIARNIIQNAATNAAREELTNTSDNTKNKIKQELTDLENNDKVRRAKKKIIKILGEVDEEQVLVELKRIRALKTKFHNLSEKNMNNAMKILADNELREFYDTGVQNGTPSPIVTYEEGKTKIKGEKKDIEILKGGLKK